MPRHDDPLTVEADEYGSPIIFCKSKEDEKMMYWNSKGKDKKEIDTRKEEEKNKLIEEEEERKEQEKMNR